MTVPAFECTGGASGSQVSIEINLFISVPIANRMIGPGSNESNALLLVDDPGPGGEVLGQNLFQFRTNPSFERELITTVTYTAKPNGAPTILRPLHVRIDTSQTEAGENIMTGALINRTQFLPDIPLAIATGAPPAYLEILEPGEVGFSEDYAAVAVVTESFPGSLRPRTLFGMAPQNVLSNQDLWRYTQSQYIPDDGSGVGDWRFAADAGNRIQIEVSGLPSDVSAVTHPYFEAAGGDESRRLGLVFDSSRQMLGGTPVPGDASPDSFFESEPTPYGPETSQQLLLEAGWVDEPGAPVSGEAAEFFVPIAWRCGDSKSLSTVDVTLAVRHAPWPQDQAPLTDEKNGFPPISRPTPGPAYEFGGGPTKTVELEPKHCISDPKPPPMVSEGGVVNGASFSGPSALGGIITIFGFGLGPEQGQAADSLPLSTELGGVSVEVDGVRMPLLFVSEPQLNIVVDGIRLPAPPPQGQLHEEGRIRQEATATLVVVRDGVRSEPVEIPIAEANPGIFTLDSGPGRAIAINLDGSLAQPVNSFPGLATRPVQVGEPLIILATGLGVTDPPAIPGDNSLDDDGAFVQRDTVLRPTVTIGGVEAQVLFSGLSPQFAGVYQLNVVPAEGTPTGDSQPLIIEIGGKTSRDDVTIAVAGP